MYGLFYRASNPPCFAFANSNIVFLTSIPSIFENVYHQKVGIAGLHYIALGVGLTLSAQLNARVMDRIYIHLKKRNNGVGMPEHRLREFLFLLSIFHSSHSTQPRFSRARYCSHLDFSCLAGPRKRGFTGLSSTLCVDLVPVEHFNNMITRVLLLLEWGLSSYSSQSKPMLLTLLLYTPPLVRLAFF